MLLCPLSALPREPTFPNDVRCVHFLELLADKQSRRAVENWIGTHEEPPFRVDSDEECRVETVRILPNRMEFAVSRSILELKAMFVVGPVRRAPLISQECVHHDAHPPPPRRNERQPKWRFVPWRTVENCTTAAIERSLHKFH